MKIFRKEFRGDNLKKVISENINENSVKEEALPELVEYKGLWPSNDDVAEVGATIENKEDDTSSTAESVQTKETINLKDMTEEDRIKRIELIAKELIEGKREIPAEKKELVMSYIEQYRVQQEKVKSDRAEKAVQSGVDTVFEVCRSVSMEFPRRIVGSAKERKSAHYIQKYMQEKLGGTAMEPFYVNVLANNYSLIVIGVLLLVSMCLYWINGWAGLVGIGVMVTYFVVQVLCNKNVFNKLFSKKTSYNVTYSIPHKPNPKKTIIFTGGYDSAFTYTWSSKNNKLVALIPIMLVISTLLLYFFCLAKLGTKDSSETLRWVQFLIPTIILGTTSGLLITFYDFRNKSQSPNVKYGLSGAGMAIALAEYYTNNPEYLPEDTRVLVAILGAEQAGNKGSEAYIKDHILRDNFDENTTVYCFDSVTDNGNMAIIKNDILTKHKTAEKTVDIVKKNMLKHFFRVDVLSSKIRHIASTAFLSKGIDAVTIGDRLRHIDKDYNNETDTANTLKRETVDRLFRTIIGVIDEKND